MSELSQTRLSTQLQHAGAEFRVGKGLVSAIEQSVTFRVDDPTLEPVYQRLSNTANNREIRAVMATLLGAESAFLTNSGMSALSLILTTELRPGDHVVCLDNCYASTRGLLQKVMIPWGLEVSFSSSDKFASHVKPNTKLLLTESISNPFCRPQDLEALCDVARKYGLVAVVDNTFASPLNCSPLRCGATYTFESATKYLGGHSDVVAGVIGTSAERMKRIDGTAMYTGVFLHTAACVLLLRSLRTFELRMNRHNESGKAVAKELARLPHVEKVWYGPERGEESLGRVFSDYGGMLCIRLSQALNVDRLCQALRYAADVPSLGGTETTVCQPIQTTHKWTSAEECRSLGIDGQLLRVSVGLEDPHDICEDFRQAIALSAK